MVKAMRVLLTVVQTEFIECMRSHRRNRTCMRAFVCRPTSAADGRAYALPMLVSVAYRYRAWSATPDFFVGNNEVANMNTASRTCHMPMGVHNTGWPKKS